VEPELRPSNRLLLLLLLVYAVLIVTTFQSYGISYDETWRLRYGEYIVSWYRSLFTDDRALDYWNLKYSGSFLGPLVAVASRLSPVDIFETSHLLSALFGLIAAIGTYKLGNSLFGRRAGVMAAVFLVAMPRFYGHSFINPVDIPFAAAAVFALYYMTRVIGQLPHPRWSDVVKLGLALGLALTTRVGGVLYVGYLGVGLGLWLLGARSGSSDPEEGAGVRDALRVSLGVVMVAGLVSYAVALLFWPAAQIRPLSHIIESLRYTTSFEYEFEVFFDGDYISNASLPWYYVPKWLILTLPELHLLTLLAGFALVTRSGLAGGRVLSAYLKGRGLALLLVVLAILVPVVYTCLRTPPNYDGVRHFLFVLPPLAVLLGGVLDRLITGVRDSCWTAALLILVVAGAGFTVADMITLHPYQYVYFNRAIAGGVARASTAYEMDYWGTSYKEGVEWLVEHYDGMGRTVGSCGHSRSTSSYVPPDRFEYLGSFGDGQILREIPDIFLATPRWRCHEKLEGRLVHTVTRQRAPLLYIKEIVSTAAPNGL